MRTAATCSLTCKRRRSRKRRRYCGRWELPDRRSDEVLERWSNGAVESRSGFFHHSITPPLHHSVRFLKMEKRFQSYRGTWAWLTQRVSAIGLFLLIPVKIYTGWAAKGKVPDLPEFIG